MRPFIDIDIVWPWQHRRRHGWRPRYQYRQVVVIDAGWQRRHYRSRIDVRTEYYHEVRYADRNRAEIDIYIDRIELYDDGRFLGEVHDIPDRLGHLRATVYRNGRVEFDRDVFLLGDRHAGFELINTRHYDGFMLNAYRRGHGLQVGELDLRRGTVYPVSYSRLFDPYDFNGYVPISLLPEDDGWLLDYGMESFSGDYYNADPYFYGGYSGYDDGMGEDNYYEDAYYEDDLGRPVYGVRAALDTRETFYVEPLTNSVDQHFVTSAGASVSMKRDVVFVRTR